MYFKEVKVERNRNSDLQERDKFHTAFSPLASGQYEMFSPSGYNLYNLTAKDCYNLLSAFERKKVYQSQIRGEDA